MLAGEGPDAEPVRTAPDDEAGIEEAHKAAEQAVREADEAIVRGEIEWLADAIREWESQPPTRISGTSLTR